MMDNLLNGEVGKIQITMEWDYPALKIGYIK
jgi:hypothetical protein